jgi:rubrerythrin
MALLRTKKVRNDSATTVLVELLNRILRLEYSLIVYYPRIAASIRNVQARQEALQLGSASVQHADTVARAITQLGGSPEWSFDPFPDENDLVKTFQRQLEKEKLAYELHSQCANQAPNAELHRTFSKLAEEEQYHMRTVEKILEKLNQPTAKIPKFF